MCVRLYFEDLLFVYLKERDRDLLSSPSCWFTAQIPTMASSELGRSREPTAPFASPTWAQGLRPLGHPVLISQAHYQEAESQMGQPGLEPAPEQDASVKDGRVIN